MFDWRLNKLTWLAPKHSTTGGLRTIISFDEAAMGMEALLHLYVAGLLLLLPDKLRPPLLLSDAAVPMDGRMRARATTTSSGVRSAGQLVGALRMKDRFQYR